MSVTFNDVEKRRAWNRLVNHTCDGHLGRGLRCHLSLCSLSLLLICHMACNGKIVHLLPVTVRLIKSAPSLKYQHYRYHNNPNRCYDNRPLFHDLRNVFLQFERSWISIPALQDSSSWVPEPIGNPPPRRFLGCQASRGTTACSQGCFDAWRWWPRRDKCPP